MISECPGYVYHGIPDASEYLEIEEYEKEYWDETGEEESEPVDIEPEVRGL